MTTRTTIAHLQAIVNRINRATNSPAEPYTREGVMGYRANLGNYHLSQAYGGCALHRMVSPGGGVSDVLRIGHVSKRELEAAMHAFIAGLEAGQVSA